MKIIQKIFITIILHNLILNAYSSTYTGETLTYPSLDNTVTDDHNGDGGADWSLGGAWRDNVGGGDTNLVFDANSTNNVGFDLATGETFDLGDDPHGLYNADPWYWAGGGGMRLAGFDTDNMTFDVNPVATGNLTAPYDYHFFIEVDINMNDTTQYRLQSSHSEFSDDGAGNVIAPAAGTISPASWTWTTDPADLVHGGVLISQIASIDYKMVMWVQDANDNAATFFYVVDTPNLPYIVIPEPSTTLSFFVVLFLLIFKRKKS